MKDLMRIEAADVRMAAVRGGWRREAGSVRGGDGELPCVAWRGPGGRLFVSADAEPLPEPLRQATRAGQVAFFERSCPVCAVAAEWLTPEQVESEVARVSPVPVHHAGERGEMRSAVFAVVHERSCPVRPESVWRMVAAAGN